MEDEYNNELNNAILNGFKYIARAITPLDALPGEDGTGITVSSLTESTMGITAGLVRIADSIYTLADAVRDLKKDLD